MYTKNYAGNVWRVTQNVNIDRKINSRYRISKHLAISSSLSGRRLTNTHQIYIVYLSVNFYRFFFFFIFIFLLLYLRLFFFYFMKVLKFCTVGDYNNSFEVHFLLIIKSKKFFIVIVAWSLAQLNEWMKLQKTRMNKFVWRRSVLWCFDQ